MLTSLHIENLRGIERGDVEGLAPLTIFLGPNGSGKSTILDALLLGEHRRIGEALALAGSRRAGFNDGARWLVRQASLTTPAIVRVSEDDRTRTTTITLGEAFLQDGSFSRTKTIRATGVREDSGEPMTAHGLAEFDYLNGTKATEVNEVAGGFVALVDSLQPFNGLRVALLYDELQKRGGVETVLAVVRNLVPEASGLRIGIDAAFKPILMLQWRDDRGAIPIGAAGDGIKLVVRAALELGQAGANLALFEEPEAHLHPRALWLLAKLVLDTVKRGVQVVIATHSLDLVQAILSECADDLSRLAIFETDLRDGKLVTSRLDGEAARHAVVDLGDDLR